ncbi:glycosyltransferase family 32 protein [Gluconacetobacter sp. Hr-1-5]|uniref:glycosyltransferase family 32 protein n=1 Tax=Gluconacetobacter sp. Hr-1-5 TaxID=3395370 RepID=UPI003B51A3AD
MIGSVRPPSRKGGVCCDGWCRKWNHDQIWENLRKIKALLTYLLFYYPSSFEEAPEAGAVGEISFLNSEEEGVCLPKIIWMYWDNPDYPKYIDTVVERLRELNPDCDVRLLNCHTLSHYIDDYMVRQAGLSATTKSDLIRLELILRYGGIWLDATILVFEDFSWIYEKFSSGRYNFVGFYYENWTRVEHFPVLENWLIASPPDDPFIRAWRDEFKKVTLGVDIYFSGLKNRSDYGDILQGVEDPKYLLAYLAAQVAMRQVPSFSVHLRAAMRSAFLYHVLSQWVPYKIALKLCANKMPAKPPSLIKITHAERYLINVIWKFNLFSKKSYLSLLKK